MTKLNIYQVINKSFILWGIKPDTKIRVYYQWNLHMKRKPIKTPCIIVDYTKESREWSIVYITDKLMSCTVDDITGSGSIQSFDNVN